MISSVPNDFNNSETSIICYKYNIPEVVKILLIYIPLQGMRLRVIKMLFLTLEFAILILKIFFLILTQITCLDRANLLALLYTMFRVFCHFPLLCPRSGVVLDCIDP